MQTRPKFAEVTRILGLIYAQIRHAPPRQSHPIRFYVIALIVRDNEPHHADLAWRLGPHILIIFCLRYSHSIFFR